MSKGTVAYLYCPPDNDYDDTVRYAYASRFL